MSQTKTTVVVLSLLTLLFTFGARGEDKSEQERPNHVTIELIAEGTGISADEAVKDAFRHAIRQAVGLVVDSETLVKSDDTIEEKILTYSDGFIREYKVIPDSKKESGGIHYVKIRARVERRSLIAKLKAANITVTAVDGEGLFAEAVTQLDAEKDATTLLKKQFEGFPENLVTGKLVGRPEILEKNDTTATLQIKIKIEPDMEAYKTFVARLKPVLDKMSKAKGDFTAVFETKEGGVFVAKAVEENETDGRFKRAVYYDTRWRLSVWMPKSFSMPSSGAYPILRTDVMTLALTTQRTKAADRMECVYYLLDKSLQPLLDDVGFRRLGGRLSLLDGEGRHIVSDKFPLEQLDTSKFVQFLGAPTVMMDGTSAWFKIGPSHDSDKRITDLKRKKAWLLWINPVFVQRNTHTIKHKPSFEMIRTLTISLDELRAVKDTRIEISTIE